MNLWDEETRKNMYVQSILSHNALGFKNPKEMNIGKKPKMSHVNIFGCLLYVHILK